MLLVLMEMKIKINIITMTLMTNIIPSANYHKTTKINECLTYLMRESDSHIWMNDVYNIFKVSRWNPSKSLTELYFFPFLSHKATDRNPCLSSDTGKQVCPAKSSDPLSLSFTSIRSNASSGTVNWNSNSSSQIGYQLFIFTLVFIFTLSAPTPAIQTCQTIKLISQMNLQNV